MDDHSLHKVGSLPGKCILQAVYLWYRSTDSRYRGGRYPSSLPRYPAVPCYSRRSVYEDLAANTEEIQAVKTDLLNQSKPSKLPGDLLNHDPFRLGPWCYSLQLMADALYESGAPHVCPASAAERRLWMLHDWVSSVYRLGRRCPPDRSWLYGLRPPWSHWRSADRSGWTPRCCGSA